jgi:iron(III) transport system permease protein
MSVIVGKRHFHIKLPRSSGWTVRLSLSWPYLLLMLIALGVAGLLLLTPVYLVVRAAESGAAAWQTLSRPSTVQAFGRTTLLAASVTAASVLIAVPLAWLTTRTDLPGRRAWAVAAALPLVLPSYVAAYLFVATFGPRGMLQGLLEPLGIERLPTLYGFSGALIVLTLLSYPYVLLSVRAAFKRLDPSLVEAARSLGLTPWQAFWRVTLPHLRPGIVAGSLLVSLYVLRDFGAVSMLRYDTFTRIIYVQYQSLSNRAVAAVLSLILVAMTALLIYLDVRTRGRATYARGSAGAARVLPPVTLGRWRWPALLFVATVVGVALIGPAGSLLYWLVRGIVREQLFTSLWLPAWNSLWVSLVAAAVAAAAALPVAILIVRRPTHLLSRLVERVTYVGFALPGLVVALALVFFGINFARAFYQTIPMLVAAYVIVFIPQAVGTSRASLLQVSRSAEEAGRSLGHSSLGVFRRVTLPLVAPGVFSGATLVFLTCMKELPATLILSPIGFKTLSISVWSSISEAFFAQAAAPSMLLILLSSIPLAILTLREA